MNNDELISLLVEADEHNTHQRFQDAERLANVVLTKLSARQGDDVSPEDDVLKSRALLTRARASEIRGDTPMAIELAEEALALAESLGRGDVASRALGTIGHVTYITGEYRKSIDYYTKAIVLDEQLGNLSAVAKNLGNIGIVMYNLSDFHGALEYHRRALEIDETRGDTSRMAVHLGNIGIVHANLSEFAQALEYFTRAVTYAEESGNNDSAARNLGNVGTVYDTIGDYAQALEYYTRALTLHESLGSKESMAIVLGNIGNVLSGLSDFQQALDYYGRALELAEEIGHQISVSTQLGNIGINYGRMSEYELALEYFQKALAIAEVIGNKTGAAHQLGRIGSAYVKLKDYAKGMEYYTKSLQLFEELGQTLEAANCKGTIGRLYALTDFAGRDEQLAERYLQESIATVLDVGARKHETYKTLAELYVSQTRWEEAYHQLTLHNRQREEVESEEAKRAASVIEQRRQAAERAKEIAIAKAATDTKMSVTTDLLHKVLPPTVAARLILGEKVADYFPNISILFADVVGFTPIAARMSAESVLQFLNVVFSECDRIMDKYGCQKIKTIGDGYMAVAGAPIPCDDHAERLARAAIDLLTDIELPESVRSSLPAGSVFHLRVGLHCGPAFAGIVGEKGFVYDVYSDAVNLASRMESHGEPGKIHCSEDFVRQLETRLHAFRFADRGEMDVKGKGMMRTYFLENEQGNDNT